MTGAGKAAAAWLLAALLLPCAAALAGDTGTASCREVPGGTQVASGEARIEVTTIGRGKPVLLLPSLGRGAHDFDPLVAYLQGGGYQPLLADPRGFGNSRGPHPQSLADLADDMAAVIASLCPGPVDVVGHAFGQRVARMLATRHPDKVHSLVMLAAGGRLKRSDTVEADLNLISTTEGVADSDRLPALQRVFFARGNDARVWLPGWSVPLARAQRYADRQTLVGDWWAGGRTDILVVHALEDPISEAGNAESLAADFGDRVRLVRLAHASHAMVPEQPRAIAAVIAAFLDGQRDPATLQAVLDRDVTAPGPP